MTGGGQKYRLSGNTDSPEMQFLYVGKVKKQERITRKASKGAETPAPNTTMSIAPGTGAPQ